MAPARAPAKFWKQLRLRLHRKGPAPWLRAPAPAPQQSRLHGEALVGLAPQTKLQNPPNWNVKHYKQVEFLLFFFNVKPPRTNAKPTGRTSKLPYWKLSGDGSAPQTCTSLAPQRRAIPSLKSRNYGVPAAPACFKVVELLEGHQLM